MNYIRYKSFTRLHLPLSASSTLYIFPPRPQTPLDPGVRSGALLTTSKLHARTFRLKTYRPSSRSRARPRPTCPIPEIMNGEISVLQTHAAFISPPGRSVAKHKIWRTSRSSKEDPVRREFGEEPRYRTHLTRMHFPEGALSLLSRRKDKSLT